MPVPTWSVGQVLAASDVNNWFVPLTVIKPSTTSRASTTTLTADPALTLTLSAGASYEVHGLIFYTGLNAGGYLGFNWTVPASGAFSYLATVAMQGGGVDGGYNNNVAGVEYGAATTVGPCWTQGPGVLLCAQISGLATGGTGGALTFNWAQFVSNGTATTINQNSYLIATRIS
jgi:hypothetical protein